MRPNWGNGRERRYEGGSWLPFNWYSIPVTRFLLFATVGTFLLYFFTGQATGPIAKYVPFVSSAPQWYTQPWTWLTYPFLEPPSFWILLTLYVLYSFGGMLERSWGSINFAVLFAVFTVIGALALVPFSYFLGQPAMMVGLTVPLTALVTAWAALDPELECCFFGVPVKAKLIAGIWVALSYFNFGMINGPVMALAVLVPPAAAFLYVRKLPRLNLATPRSQRPRAYGDRWAPDLDDQPRRGGGGLRGLLREDPDREERPRKLTEEPEKIGGFNPLRKRQEQAEMERLRKLLGEDDDGRSATRH
jgi:membrane associated rhomboid family serine protease